MILENQKVTSSIEENMLVSMNKFNSEKRLRYGLKILIELADRYHSGGIDLMSIIKSDNFNLYILMHVMSEMKNAGMIDCKVDNPNWLFLKEEPGERWVLEIVPKLRSLFHTEGISQ